MFLLTAVGSPILFADIVDGNFEAGWPGYLSGDFASGYTPVTPGGGDHSLYPEGAFTVTTDPHLVHNLWSSFGDHTTGTGQMMIVNGDTQNGVVVWAGHNSAPLAPGEYTFSAWVASLYPTNPANLTFSVDDLRLGNFTASATPGLWQQFSQTFTITSANPTFGIVNLNTQANGNDFAIDDIHLEQVPEAGFYSALALNLGGLLLFVRRRRKA
jgi:hypothetical protein